MALTKERIITQVYEKAGLSKVKSREAVEILLEIIKDTLASGDNVLISGFGKFIVRSKGPRRGRNPQTQETLELKARKVVVFKTSGVLRNKINAQK
ncbi:MAG TPA: integration host factor subunit alpha [Syntrophaceae bacterium]|nr:integration host factor subunit alpha [Syntrophaceae bacterium]